MSLWQLLTLFVLLVISAVMVNGRDRIIAALSSSNLYSSRALPLAIAAIAILLLFALIGAAAFSCYSGVYAG